MILEWIYQHFGDEWNGETSLPPGSTLSMKFGPNKEGEEPFYRVSVLNDGYELRIGYSDKWVFRCWMSDARQLAKFILWDYWIKGTWCGLKRRLWYYALQRLKVYGRN
jgi:hypothetical protein